MRAERSPFSQGKAWAIAYAAAAISGLMSLVFTVAMVAVMGQEKMVILCAGASILIVLAMEAGADDKAGVLLRNTALIFATGLMLYPLEAMIASGDIGMANADEWKRTGEGLVALIRLVALSSAISAVLNIAETAFWNGRAIFAGWLAQFSALIMVVLFGLAMALSVPALLEEGAMIAFSGLFFVCWYGRNGFLGSTTRSEHTDG